MARWQGTPVPELLSPNLPLHLPLNLPPQQHLRPAAKAEVEEEEEEED
jgi:hypothetical protein